MRGVLQAGPDQSVTLLLTGQMRNAARLLRSPPDAHSPLKGAELVRKKVNEVVLMGGCFRTPEGENPAAYHLHGEYNLRLDIDSARYLSEYCPVPLVYCGYELGSRVITGGPLVDKGDTDNPVRFCYAVHSGGGRESWDLLAALYAAQGLAGRWSKSPPGRVYIEPDGVSRLEEAAGGRDAYLVESLPPAQMQRLLDALLLAPPIRMEQMPAYLADATAV